YDSGTGNKILEVRPAEMIASGADPTLARATHYSFDTTYSLFPVEVRNELAQRISRTFDLGTGLKTQESGPNERMVQICQPKPGPKGGLICHATRVFEERDWSYDGLGRLLSESTPHDDPSRGYVPTVVRRLRYAAFPQNVATEFHALEWGACDCG